MVLIKSGCFSTDTFAFFLPAVKTVFKAEETLTALDRLAALQS